MGFEAVPLSLDKLSWRPASKGREPEAVLKAEADVLGVPYEFHAFRAFTPFLSGWSRSMCWEDDRNVLGPGVMWDAEETRLLVADCDEGLPPPEQRPLDSEEEEWEERWMAAAQLAGRFTVRWTPSLVGRHRYHVFGVPIDAPSARAALVRPRPSDRRGDLPARPGIGRVAFSLGGGRLDLLHVRTRRLGGSISPSDPGSAREWRRVLDIIRVLGGSPTPCDWGDGPWLGVFMPADAVSWDVDTRGLAAVLAQGLEPGMSRWVLRRPERRPDAFDARALENLARDIRGRRLARRGDRAWASRRMDDEMDALGAGKERDDVRNRLFRVLTNTVMMGVSMGEGGRLSFRRTQAVEQVFVFPDTMSACPSPDFAVMAEGLADGDLLGLSMRNTVFTVPQPVPLGEPPEWTRSLPPLLDGRLERMWSELRS